MPRETQQLADQVQQLQQLRVVRLEARLADAIGVHGGVPPLHGAGQPLGLHGVEPDDLGHVAQRAARPVADDRGGERGAVAAVLAVDVLDDFFAPLVLEIDVDVGRLVALARDEALHEQLAARGIHLGDAQAVTHHGVRGRAAPLAEDVEAPRLAHDVVHREEVGLVVEIGDQRQLVVDLRAHGFRHALRPAPARTRLGELAQVRGRGFACRHQLARIFVTQLVEREVRERRDLHGFGEQFGRIELREPLALAQVAFAVREQPLARLRQRDAVAHGGQRILQAAALAHVHVHVAGGRERQSMQQAEPPATFQMLAVAAVAQQLHRDPGALREGAREPRSLVGRRVGANPAATAPACRRHGCSRAMRAIAGIPPRRRAPAGSCLFRPALRPRVMSRDRRP